MQGKYEKIIEFVQLEWLIKVDLEPKPRTIIDIPLIQQTSKRENILRSSGNIIVKGAREHNLKNIDVVVQRGKLTVITGVSGSGKSSLAFDTILAEAQRRFFYTLSNYSRQFLDLGTRPKLRSISGLSPAIALEQNETQISPKATVGTLTDVSELLGVLFARFGQQRCPKHNKVTTSQSTDQIADQLESSFNNKSVFLLAPIAHQKKGNFATRMEKLAAKGYLKAIIDGEMVALNPVPSLVKEEKHDIAIVIDSVTVHSKNSSRLRRSIESCIEESEGYGLYGEAFTGSKVPKNWGPIAFSNKGGCPECGYSWPKLDSRYFSTNSLGRCEDCSGYGSLDILGEDEDLDEDSSEDLGSDSDLDRWEALCETCKGTGLNPNLHAIKIGDHSVIDLSLMSLTDLLGFVAMHKKHPSLAANPAFLRVLEEVSDGLKRACDLGLGYLSLSRRISTLSGGEAQRLKLAGILAESLKGVLYVLDEPSQGLHATELKNLVRQMHILRDLGNTLIVVDHDETIMKAADEIIDLGPTGGVNGGNILAQFQPNNAAGFQTVSATAKHLVGPFLSSVDFAKKPTSFQKFIAINNASLNNLNIPKVSFPIGALTVVCGVSGSGKTSLARGVLFDNLLSMITASNSEKSFKPRACSQITGADDLEMVWNVDRRPIAKSSVSMPASYLDIFSEIRQIYGELPESQVAGLTQRSFSLSVDGGRCDECRGRGEVLLKMRFLSDARIPCSVCKTKRYKDVALGIKYLGLNISEVLNLSIDEAIEHFKNHRKIIKNLRPAVAMGLGYLKLGQPSSSLSGGEAQRLKIVPLLSKNLGEGTLLVIDEPTTGLHFEDVLKLKSCLEDLCKRGTTVILIEHNELLIGASDWIVELGPGSANEGGNLIFEGNLKKMRELAKQTPTSSVLFSKN